MKKIKPLQIWKPGVTGKASALSASITADNLRDSAFIAWQLLDDSQKITLAYGSESISGDDYLVWDGSNDYVFSFIASKIGVEIIE